MALTILLIDEINSLGDDGVVAEDVIADGCIIACYVLLWRLHM